MRVWFLMQLSFVALSSGEVMKLSDVYRSLTAVKINMGDSILL